MAAILCASLTFAADYTCIELPFAKRPDDTAGNAPVAVPLVESFFPQVAHLSPQSLLVFLLNVRFGFLPTRGLPHAGNAGAEAGSTWGSRGTGSDQCSIPDSQFCYEGNQTPIESPLGWELGIGHWSDSLGLLDRRMDVPGLKSFA